MTSYHWGFFVFYVFFICSLVYLGPGEPMTNFLNSVLAVLIELIVEFTSGS